LRPGRSPAPGATAAFWGQALLACVDGEGHGIAARMLADFLWHVDTTDSA